MLPALEGKESLTNIEYNYAHGKTEIIALGYEFSVNQSVLVDGGVFNWNERRLVVRSIKAYKREELALREPLEKAQVALSQLGQRPRGKKLLRTKEDWQSAK